MLLKNKVNVEIDWGAAFKYEEESVNKTEMDIKRKSHDIRASASKPA
jgi:hypothetical protein